MKKALIILFSITLFIACKSKKEIAQTEQAKPEAIKELEKANETSKIAVDWTGTYYGQLPCADCEGIETSLSLSKDLSYVLTMRYIGKPDKPSIQKGKFLWDEKGNKITLFMKSGNTIYKVLDGVLQQLGHNQEEITGDLAKMYNLYKSKSPIIGKYWKLIEINGQAVKMTENMKQPHLKFMSKNQFTGTGGCNSMFGTFTLENKRMISFSGIGMTEMACNFESFDLQLSEALSFPAEVVMIGEDEMRFQVGKRMPHLRFKAEYF